jgi:hypothetical protein
LFREVDLTEVSIVGVPACAGAIADTLQREKRFISPQLRKALTPYAARPHGRCFAGWCPGLPIAKAAQSGCGCKGEDGPPAAAVTLATVIRRTQDALDALEPEIMAAGDDEFVRKLEPLARRWVETRDRLVRLFEEQFPALDHGTVAEEDVIELDDDQDAAGVDHRDEIVGRYDDDQIEMEQEEVLDEYRRPELWEVERRARKALPRMVEARFRRFEHFIRANLP